MKPLSLLSMKSRFQLSVGLLALVVLASILSGLASQKQTALSEAEPVSFFSQEEVETAQLIRIETATESYALAKETTGWVMSSKDNARIDPDKIARLLDALGNLNTNGRTTALPERLDELGLGEPADGGFGARLSLDTGNEVLILGVKRGRQYVRRTDSPQSWRAEPLLPPLHNPSWWLEFPDLENLLRADLVVDISEGHPARTLRVDDQSFFLDVLKDIEILDLRAASEGPVVRIFRLDYADGSKVAVSLKQVGSDSWITISGREGTTSQEYLIDALSASDLASIEAPEGSTGD